MQHAFSIFAWAESSGHDSRSWCDIGTNGRRVLKSVQDPNTQERRYTGEVFPTLRLNMAPFDVLSNDYTRKDDFGAIYETVYLVSGGSALARVIYDSDKKLPSADGKQQHVYFTLTDPLGSTSVVIDKASSELVERSTYQAYGAAESDYRPERWQSFREDYRFTGKEDDIGVGLTYFGARYYIPALGQWASADPLTVHALGSDLNPYAFAMGSPQRLVDLNGLIACDLCNPAGGAADFLSTWESFVRASEQGAAGGTPSEGPSDFFLATSTTGLPHVDGIPVFVTYAGQPPDKPVQLAQNTLKNAPIGAPDNRPIEVTVHGERPWLLVLSSIARTEICGPSTLCDRLHILKQWDYWTHHPDEFEEGAKDKADKLHQILVIVAIVLSMGKAVPSGPQLTPVTADGAVPAAVPTDVPMVPPPFDMASKGAGSTSDAPQYKAPKSGSGAEKATDVPSWARGERPLVGENGRDFAGRLLNNKYGESNWQRGAGSEFSKIQKWGDRGFEDP